MITNYKTDLTKNIGETEIINIFTLPRQRWRHQPRDQRIGPAATRSASAISNTPVIRLIQCAWRCSHGSTRE